MAVTPSVRHEDTAYDDLLASGMAREDARARVHEEVAAALDRWRRPAG